MKVRLSLEAESKNNIGYTPDWIQVTYLNKNGNATGLTLDIQGRIAYNNEKLYCDIKGKLIPWTENDAEGEEISFYDWDEDRVAKLYPPEEILRIIKMGKKFLVGVYPTIDEKEFNKAENDKITEGKGYLDCEIYGKYESINFDFEAELNL